MQHQKLLTLISALALFSLSGCASHSSFEERNAAAVGLLGSIQIEPQAERRMAATAETTPLHQAALYGQTEKISAALQQGYSPNAYDENGFTAVHWAATNQHSSAAENLRLLIEAGGDPNIPHKTAKRTPLHSAKTVEAINILIKHGAHVNAQDISGGTPLHNADKPEIAKALLQHGADRTITNLLNQTPVQRIESMLPFYNKDEPIYRQLKQEHLDSIAVINNWSGSPSPTSVADNNDYEYSYDEQPDHYGSPIADNQNQQPDEDLSEKKAKELESKQVCPMYDFDWFYTGTDCQNDLAHGKGEAINPYDNLRFEGEIAEGVPVEGTLYEGEGVLYEGKFAEGVAHGSGICFHKGSPEECRYYKGERIDSLHKQRQEFERQQEILSEQKQTNDDYDSSSDYDTDYDSESYSENDYSNSSYQSDRYQGDTYQAPRHNTRYSRESDYGQEDSSDPVTEAIQEELIEQGTKMLLDQFF